jgi:hypothetical protein
MKTLNWFPLILITALAAMAESAHGQQPPDVVTSDSNGNTAMGTDALFSLMPGGTGENTASGAYALWQNTTGGSNSAFGAGALNQNTIGSDNTAIGYGALNHNTMGGNNTASGIAALLSNQTGNDNTASGYGALLTNTTGSANTAFGSGALNLNTTGQQNTASGYQALQSNTTGNANTASGVGALFSDTGGSSNTASGVDALYFDTMGSNNTASGYFALYSNTTGDYNSASGMNALYKNTTGTQNTGSGYQALYSNKTGGGNTASGLDALYRNTSGHYNIAEGYKAGFNLTTGSYNIDIGNSGVAAESGIIRIGTQVPTPLQTHTYIAGIYNNTSVSGLTVVVDSNGQLGAVASSERFKTGIAPMGSNTTKLGQLRPVTFHLKTDPQGALRYGLIAEEVAKVYPELVIRNESGRIDGVRYDELAPMLLNEVQQQQRMIDAQANINAAQAAQLRDVQRQLAVMQGAFAKLERNEIVAQR